MRVLVTGGAGFIGSHTCVELLNTGYDVTVVDNLVNSKEDVINRIKKITGKTLKFYKADIKNKNHLDSIFSSEKIEAVIHFAGLKAVGESVKKPLEYYSNNIEGSICLLESMKKHGVKNIVFSSSATVYGLPKEVPITEDFPLSATNPYGRTKLMIENILSDVYESDKKWNIVILRYFNPIGAHKSGLIGEDPQGIPNNLLPYVAQVATGKLDYVRVFGNDYKTKDGTGIRDYIHVVDLSIGHIKALSKISSDGGFYIYNLGTGKGYSVLEVIRAFEKASGKEIKYKIVGRRSGDIAISYADTQKAYTELGFKAEKNLADMCNDAWHWQSKNPDGYV